MASHDVFGPGTTEHSSAVTFVYRSEDRGTTWRNVARIEPAFWSNLFVHEGTLYLLGTTHHHGLVVIRRSDDGGFTWTEPKDEASGLLTVNGHFHTGPMPILLHRGKIWRAVENAGDGGAWGERYRPMLMSASTGVDLLRRDSWAFTRPLAYSKAWLDGAFVGMLEGNAVVTSSGVIGNLLRVACPDGEKAALTMLSADGASLEFSPENGFVDLPGGATKFTVRYDEESGRCWTLSNWVPQRYEGSGNASLVRNTLALLCSANLRDWELRSVVLHHPDSKRHGFQYVDWLVDGADLVAVSRTGHDDAWGGALKAHDANYLTFHRVPRFRTTMPADSVVSLDELQTPSL
ncbi:MAG TPA: sialidase family protein [Rariglobus sp.]|nr:sialidase family protein [Rariglobus sp.]